MYISSLTNDPALRPPHSLLMGYFLTGCFCLAVALLLWVLGVASLKNTVIISLSIGWTINTFLVLFQHRLERLLPAALVPIPLQILGLIVGLVIGAWLVIGDPWYFFQRERLTLFLGVFFAAMAYVIFGTLSRLAESKAQLAEARRLQAEQDRQLADTQLKLLQAQIEPHFLFNTLSNATSLIDSDPGAAQATLENLTVLLRNSLQRTRASQTTLGEEVDMLNAYLKIAQIRMGDRLQFEIEVPDTLRAQPLPPLLLQPLVENAITHGLEPKADGGSVRLSAHATGKQLHLLVCDTGLGINANNSSAEPAADSGTALANIRARLRALYGEGEIAELRLRDNAPNGMIAELCVPLVHP